MTKVVLLEAEFEGDPADETNVQLDALVHRVGTLKGRVLSASTVSGYLGEQFDGPVPPSYGGSE